MSAPVQVSGLPALQRRLKALGAAPGLAPALRQGAEAIAGDAKAALAEQGDAELARSVEILDVSQGGATAFAVGTAQPAGRYLEFGTVKSPAKPWLIGALGTHLPALKQTLRTLFSAKSSTSAS